MNPNAGASAMTMTVNPINFVAEFDSSPVDTEALTIELIDIHCRAGHFVAELSERPGWADADLITIRLIAEAYAVATPTVPAHAVSAPAVLRCRELAVAQRRMVIALEGHGLADVDVATLVRARALLAELAELCATIRR
jgi:hypothetical protein